MWSKNLRLIQKKLFDVETSKYNTCFMEKSKPVKTDLFFAVTFHYLHFIEVNEALKLMEDQMTEVEMIDAMM